MVITVVKREQFCVVIFVVKRNSFEWLKLWWLKRDGIEWLLRWLKRCSFGRLY